jgi:hypothetical protein
MISNSFSSGNTMDVRSRGCSCSISRREDKPQPGRTGRACSVSTAIPSRTSWSGTLREGRMPRWRYMPPLANALRCPQRSWPVLSKFSSVQKGWLPMRHCASGYGGHTGWRSSTRRSITWCARASTSSSKCRASVRPKKPAAIPAFQASCQAHLEQPNLFDNLRPLRVFSQDKNRLGLLTVRRRRLTARGVQIEPH